MAHGRDISEDECGGAACQHYLPQHRICPSRPMAVPGAVHNTSIGSQDVAPRRQHPFSSFNIVLTESLK